MIFAGVDIGSTTSKAVLLDENGKNLTFALIYTTFDRNQSGEDVLKKALEQSGNKWEDVAFLVSTGYGRKAFERANMDLPEIICHATGTHHLYPGVRTIIDIGGQDSKVIEMDGKGMVTRFEMNDKCAAGTGRFFEVLTNRLLNVPMEELGELALRSDNPCVISSMCTIFAESEIISLLSQGIPKEDIVAGMCKSVTRRIVNMGKSGQITYQEPIIFSGGVANNEGVRAYFEQVLKKKVTAILMPQSTAAFGAALAAKENYEKAHG